MYSGGIARYSIGTSEAIFTRKMACVSLGVLGKYWWIVLGRYWGSTTGVLGKQWAVLCGSSVGVRLNSVGGTGEVLG
jgi:hypothetical protein